MSKSLEKIKQLIALGEKATHGEWCFTRCTGIIKSARCRIAWLDHYNIPDTAASDGEFIELAANTRADLAEFVAEYERMRLALRAIERMANDDGIFYTELRTRVFHLAKQAIQETEQGE